VGCDDVYGVGYSGWGVVICVWYRIQWVGCDDVYGVGYSGWGVMMCMVQDTVGGCGDLCMVQDTVGGVS